MNPMITKTLLPLVAALALAGCGSLAPAPSLPLLPVATSFAGQGAGPVASNAASDIDWRNFFTDARLKRLNARNRGGHQFARAARPSAERGGLTHGIER